MLSRILSCVTTKLVSCVEEPPALCGPVEDAGEPVVESDSDGECLANLEAPTPLLPSPCEADDKLATDDAKRGLLPEVSVRDLSPDT